MGFEKYQVSNLGRVRSFIQGFCQTLKTRNNKDGYVYVILSGNCGRKTLKVHRLVANAFIPNVYGKREVNHKNGIKSDNSVENLEWVTKSENEIHAYKTGLKKTSEKQKAAAAMTSKTVNSKKVVQYTMGMACLAEYPSASEASRQTKIQLSDICSCCRGRLKSAGKYFWRYKTYDDDNDEKARLNNV